MITVLAVVIIALCFWLAKTLDAKKKLESGCVDLYSKAKESAVECENLSKDLLAMMVDRDIYKNILDKHITRSVELSSQWNCERASLMEKISELERFIASEGIEVEWVDVEENFLKK